MMETNEMDYLAHYGILGMRWGIRRYQNKDGTLTEAGKKRKAKLQGELDQLSGSKGQSKGDNSKPTTKSVKSMTDEELKSAYTRLKAEKDYIDMYRQMNPQKVTVGQRVMDKLKTEVIPNVASSGLQKFGQELTNRLVEQYVGSKDPLGQLKAKEAKLKILDSINTYEKRLHPEVDPLKDLKQESDKWKYQRDISIAKRKIAENDDWYNSRYETPVKDLGSSSSNSSKGYSIPDVVRKIDFGKSFDSNVEKVTADVVGNIFDDLKSSTGKSYGGTSYSSAARSSSVDAGTDFSRTYYGFTNKNWQNYLLPGST